MSQFNETETELIIEAVNDMIAHLEERQKWSHAQTREEQDEIEQKLQELGTLWCKLQRGV